MTSIAWAFINQFGNHILNLVLSLILASFLTPAEFGTFAMITILTDFSYVLNNFGFGQYLIKEQTPSIQEINTVFWVNISISILVSLVLIFIANFIAKFYGIPLLEHIIYWIPIGYILRSLGLVSQYMLVKAINYKLLFKSSFYGRLLAGVIAIIFAYHGYGIWSLVILHITTSVVIAVFAFYCYPWKPQFIFSIQALKRMLSYSLNVFGNESLNYWLENIDKFIIGKFLNSAGLGLYSRAYSLVMLPINNGPRVVDKYLFPYLSKAENQDKINQELYLKTIELLAYVIIPIMCFMIFTAKDLIHVIFTSDWYGLINLMQVLALSGLFVAFVDINTSIFLVLNQSNKLFKINLLTRFILVIGIFIGVRWDVIGVAYSLVFSNIIRLVITMVTLKSFFPLSISAYIYIILPTILITLFIILITYLFEQYFLYSFNSGFRFLCISSVLLFLYIFISSIFNSSAYLFLKTSLKRSTN